MLIKPSKSICLNSIIYPCKQPFTTKRYYSSSAGCDKDNKANIKDSTKDNTKDSIKANTKANTKANVDIKVVAIFTLDKLNDKAYISSNRDILKKKGGIYAFINTVNGKQYIGSAKDFYLRLNEHLNKKKSNSSLQFAFDKYGL